jgi:hypothetical protein
MESIISELLNTLNSQDLIDSEIINWACPIPFFGDIKNSKIATLALNPSNLEFVDNHGIELSTSENRLPTLKTLGLDNWNGSDSVIKNNIFTGCSQYFENRPYNFWFKKLDYLISGAGYSYYFPDSNACHLDIVPFATKRKWNELDQSQRSLLLEKAGDFLGKIINNSQIHTIVANGMSVVTMLEEISNQKFDPENKPEWATSRGGGNKVMGKSFLGLISKIGNIPLNKNVRVLGFNHNIQSSFGITRKIQSEIRYWITSQIKDNEQKKN